MKTETPEETMDSLLRQAESRDLYIMLETRWGLSEQYRFTCYVRKRGDHMDNSTGAGSNTDLVDALDKAIANWDKEFGGDS